MRRGRAPHLATVFSRAFHFVLSAKSSAARSPGTPCYREGMAGAGRTHGHRQQAGVQSFRRGRGKAGPMVGQGRGRGSSWRQHPEVQAKPSEGTPTEQARSVGSSRVRNTYEEALEAKFGLNTFTEGDPRLGWLLNMSTSSMEDRNRNNQVFSCVNLYFMCQDGSSFKAQVKFCPYFYVGTKALMEREVEAYLRRRYGEQFAAVELVEKEDLDLKNHLSGLRRTYLKLSFNTVQDLMAVKSDLLPLALRNQAKLEAAADYDSLLQDLSGKPKEKPKVQDYIDYVMEVREYDVPYHVRFAIDCDVRCGLWYNVSVHESSVKLEKRTDLLQRAEVRVCAFDIETTKLPLKFPDASYDIIMMISYMLDGQGYLIVNRECVGEDIEDIEYSPKPEFEGMFKVTNVTDERELLKCWFNHMLDVKPGIYVTYNGDFFDWPFIEHRAKHHGMDMHSETGFRCDQGQGECLSKFACHLDCFAWVKRDSYLPQGSQGLKAVTKVKLGYDPLEVNPEDMVRFAMEQPQTMASYSVSDALSTYYLYMTYVHPFIFSLATIIPMSPDEVLRKGSGTLCEMLLMVQAFKGNIICPNKHKSELDKIHNGHLLESETYIGGHVECLESGVFRSDLPTRFHLVPDAFQKLIDNLDRDLKYAIGEGKVDIGFVTNYDDVKEQVKRKLEGLRDAPIREELPLIYHLDVAAMYPNIILTNRLQPSSVVTDSICAACDFNRPEKTCLRKMEWVWRGEMYSAKRSEYIHLKNQIEAESFPTSDSSTDQFFHNLPKDQQQSKLKDRLKKYCQKVYKRVLDKPITELRSANICMRENSFYVDTVRSFRDRRYEYKGLNKVWKGKLVDAKVCGNPLLIQEAQDMVVLYDSLQLAHKCILNSFYGYVMRKGARWYSMEMAGVVTYTGAKIIQNTRLLVEQIGRPLELDTDGIWCALPASFPDSFSFTLGNSKKLTFSYPCVMLNVDVALSNTNDQYQTMVDSVNHTYITSKECSIEFEVDGPYKAMILPASKEEGVLIKKRYAVFNPDGSLAELKGFEVKRRGELKLIKIFQAEVFENFLHGETLEQCYAAVGAVADRWLDFLETQGADVADVELLDYISESSTMSKSLAEYGETKSCATTTAKRLADFLGDTMVKDKGLRCHYIIASSPQGAPVSERAIPVAIFETEPEISRVYLRKWCKCATDATIRSILDWAYYRQRLSSAIQKIITIPAAMQKVRNPVPRVIHPDWLWKKVQEKDDKRRQRSIRDMFGPQRDSNFNDQLTISPSADIEDSVIGKQLRIQKGTRPLVRTFQVNKQEDIPRDDQHHDAGGYKEAVNIGMQPVESLGPLQNQPRLMSPSKTGNYEAWLEHKKRKWKENRDRRKRLRQCTDVEERHVRDGHTRGRTPASVLKNGAGLGAYFMAKEAALVRSHWQVLQLAPSAVPGEFLAWVIAEGNMFKVLLKVPRVFIVNTRASDSSAHMGPHVTRQLPHGRPCYNLVEVSVDEEQFRDVHRELAGHLADPHVEGVYESQMPLALHAVLQLGCVCEVDKKSRTKSAGVGWSLGDLRMKTTTECSYLPDSLSLFYLYQSISDSRGLYVLHIHDRGTVDVVIVNPFNNREVNSSQLERQFRDHAGTKSTTPRNQDNMMKFRIDYVTDNTEAARRLQRTLAELREGCQRPTLGLLECSRRDDVLALVPALADFPCVDVGSNAKDVHYQALGWQSVAARVAMHKCSRVSDWFYERLALSQYAHVPLGNFVGDWIIFTADIFFSRALRDHQQVLWTSNNGLPDLGGNCEEDGSYVDEVQQPVLSLPGAYRSISVELKMHHLAVNALLKCNHVWETEGGTLPTAGPEVAGGIQSVLEQPSWDESLLCAPAFQTLKAMVQGWLADATASANPFADNLLQHLYRWLCSPQSKLHDPALHRILHKVMLKVYALLLLELRKLGATVVFADFSRILVNTGKNDLLGAQGYCEYLVKALRSRDLFEWIELVPHRSWHSLLFMDQYNYGGLEVEVADLSSPSGTLQECDTYRPAVVSCWNIANYLPTEAEEFFILIATEYIYFPWKHGRQTLLAQDGANSLTGAAAIESDALECAYLKEQISSYFTDKLLRMVRDLQGKFLGKKLTSDTKHETSGLSKSVRANTGLDPALEFVKHTCAVLALDKRVQHDIQVLRKNLLKLVHAREFSGAATFSDPCRSFTLPNVICSYCNDCRDLDLCRDPILLQKDWSCRSNACQQLYDLGWIENALVQIVRQRERAYQLQDLACLKCLQVKASHVSEQCVCGGSFTCTETAAEYLTRMKVFLEIATHYNFGFLEECVNWILCAQ